MSRAGTGNWGRLQDGRLREVDESWGCSNDGGGGHRRWRGAGHADLGKCGKCGDIRRFASWQFGFALDGCKGEGSRPSFGLDGIKVSIMMRKR